MFIVLEGIDGSGKTTQAARLAAWFSERLGEGRVVVTREPGGWSGGERVRELALEGNFSSVWTEFFLFMADRCEHVCGVISPAIARGQAVICDRYWPSTMAYQILSRADIPGDTVQYIVGMFDKIGLPSPDRVFFLDIEPEEARRRLVRRGKSDSFDARGSDFFAAVRAGYHALMASNTGSWIKIDASSGEDAVCAEIKRNLDDCLTGELNVR